MTLSSPTTTRPTELSCVPETPRRDPRHPCFGREAVHQPSEVVRVDRFAERCGEHQTSAAPCGTGERCLRLLARPVFGHDGGCRRAEGHDPGTGLGLELLENRTAALDGQLLDDLELTPLKVDVLPAEGEQLTPSQTGHQADVEGSAQPVVGEGSEKLLRLRQRPALPARAPRPSGRLRKHHRVARQPTALHRLLEGHREDLANEAGRRGAQSGPFAIRSRGQRAEPAVDDLGGQVAEADRAE